MRTRMLLCALALAAAGGCKFLALPLLLVEGIADLVQPSSEAEEALGDADLVECDGPIRPGGDGEEQEEKRKKRAEDKSRSIRAKGKGQIVTPDRFGRRRAMSPGRASTGAALPVRRSARNGR